MNEREIILIERQHNETSEHSFISFDEGGPGGEFPSEKVGTVIANLNGSAMVLERENIRALRDALTKWLGDVIPIPPLPGSKADAEPIGGRAQTDV